jgi:hypothetical protein
LCAENEFFENFLNSFSIWLRIGGFMSNIAQFFIVASIVKLVNRNFLVFAPNNRNLTVFGASSALFCSAKTLR